MLLKSQFAILFGDSEGGILVYSEGLNQLRGQVEAKVTRHPNHGVHDFHLPNFTQKRLKSQVENLVPETSGELINRVLTKIAVVIDKESLAHSVGELVNLDY